MKSAVVFLSIFVAVSHQQYHLPRILGFPRLSSFNQQLAFIHNFNQYKPSNRLIYQDMLPVNSELDNLYEEFHPKFSMTENKDFADDENSFSNIQARMKVPKKSAESGGVQDARFALRTVTGNPLLKTVTFSITSTCTSIKFTSCIPATAFAAAPGNFNPASCRRKRDVESLISENEQFSVNPSQVYFVTPTATAGLALKRDNRERKFEIISSILENKIATDRSTETGIEKREVTGIKWQPRKGKFYYFWQSFAVGTTITTWSITSTTLTQTFAPVLAADVFLPCLPPGYFVCPGSNNGK